MTEEGWGCRGDADPPQFFFVLFFLLEWFTAATGNQHLVLGRHGAGGDPDHLLWTPSLV